MMWKYSIAVGRDMFVKKKSLIKNCIGMDIDTTDIDHPDCSK